MSRGWGFGFRVWGFKCGVQGLGVQGLRVQGLGFRVKQGFWVLGHGSVVFGVSGRGESSVQVQS